MTVWGNSQHRQAVSLGLANPRRPPVKTTSTCWAILGPLRAKIYSESAFMTIKSKKAQVLDSLGLFRFLSGRGERIRTSGLYVPNVALYQAKLHPVGASRYAIALSRDAHVRVKFLLWQAFSTVTRAIPHKSILTSSPPKVGGFLRRSSRHRAGISRFGGFLLLAA